MTFSLYGGLANQKVVDLLLNGSAEEILTNEADEKLYAVEIDNTKNAEDIWAKIWVQATAASVGTDHPLHVIYCEAGEVRVKIFGGDQDVSLGHVMHATSTHEVFIGAVTTGGTGGTTSPPNPVKATVWTS